MADATYYTRVGEATEMANQNGTEQGKLTNSISSYCINILKNLKAYGKSHIGKGLWPDDQLASESNIDCLMCHNEYYAFAEHVWQMGRWLLLLLQLRTLLYTGELSQVPPGY
jgi:hypothetical protein